MRERERVRERERESKRKRETLLLYVSPGPLGAGKTSLMLRYIYDTFEDKISRFVSEEKKSVTVDGREVVLDIWDTAGKLMCTCMCKWFALISFTIFCGRNFCVTKY